MGEALGRRRGRIAGSQCWGLARWWRGSRIGSGRARRRWPMYRRWVSCLCYDEIRDGEHGVAEKADVFRLEVAWLFAVAVVDTNDGDGGLTRFAGEGRGDVVVVVVDATSGEDGEEGERQEGARDGHARVAFGCWRIRAKPANLRIFPNIVIEY